MQLTVGNIVDITQHISPRLNLARGLRLRGEEPARVAFVGAGGKTTAIFQLARELPPPVLVTATTHLALDQIGYADRHFIITAGQEHAGLEDLVSEGVTVVTGPVAPDGRTSGVGPEALEYLHGLADTYSLHLLVEADGSRQRPLKAPGPHEPPIPDFLNLVVVLAGLTGLGKPLDAKWVHRPEQFAALSKLSPGDRIGPAAVVDVLLHPAGGMKNIPPHARRVVLLNQASTPDLQAQAQLMAARIFAIRNNQPGDSASHSMLGYSSVLVADLKPASERQVEANSHRGIETASPSRVLAVHERIAGVVLAAGSASRLGQPKQLLSWRGQALVRTVVQTAISAGLSQVILVTGAFAERVEKSVKDLPVRIVRNLEWDSGQSTSLRAGLGEILPGTGGVIFLLADQPQIPITLLRSLIDIHAETLAPIIAPIAGGRRANPVLFDRVTFDDLSGIHGEAGGRQLFSWYPVTRFEWQDESILLDVDTLEDYHRLLALE